MTKLSEEPRISDDALEAAPADEWRSYDEFAAGIDTFRLPGVDLTGSEVGIVLADGPSIRLRFGDAGRVTWTGRRGVRGGGRCR